MENILDFRFPNQQDPLKNIDSKTKTAFTRAYNTSSHTSQALHSQGAASAKKAKPTPAVAESEAGEDGESESESSSEEDVDVSQFRAKKVRKVENGRFLLLEDSQRSMHAGMKICSVAVKHHPAVLQRKVLQRRKQLARNNRIVDTILLK